MQESDRERLSRYEQRTTIPLVILAVGFLFLYAIPIVWPNISDTAHWIVDALSAIVWFVFVIDLGTRAYLSGRPVAYLIRHPVDFLLIALPMLRPLRVLRVFTAANFLVARGGRFAVGRTITSAVVAAGFLVLVAALAMLDAERGAPGSNIETYGQALWWAGVTVTTVGYGDTYPVTVTGRLVAFALMLVGISMLGIVTASVAAWFVSHTRAAEDEVLTELRALRSEVAEIRKAQGDTERAAAPEG